MPHTLKISRMLPAAALLVLIGTLLSANLFAGAAPATTEVNAMFGRLPLNFEVNRGQADKKVDFLSRGRGYTLLLAATEAAVSMKTGTVRWRMSGAAPNAQGQALEELPGKVNYFIGGDSQLRLTGIPTYERVRYRDIYPGVDLIYYGSGNTIEHDFIVAPGADPQNILLTFEPFDARIDATGDLLLSADGKLRLRKPVLYQETGGVRRRIEGGYRKLHGAIGFKIGKYDPAKPLIIDPALDFSTYLGGAGNDSAQGIGLDSAGNVYVAGTTNNAASFPGPAVKLAAAVQDDPSNAFSFVVKLDSKGVLKTSTYFNGRAYGIAVSPAGKVHVVGSAASPYFPVKAGAYSTQSSGGSDAFVLTLAPDNNGQLQIQNATFLGGSLDDVAYGVSVNSQSDSVVYVTGTTYSSNFPAKNAFQNALTDPFHDGTSRDAFIASLDTSLTGADQLIYSTYMGGSSSDDGFGIAGAGFVTGQTCSNDLPGKAAANPLPVNIGFQSTNHGGCDAFVAAVTFPVNGKAFLYFFTYLGGSSWELGRGISLSGYNNIVVTGETASSNFPVSADAYQSQSGGGSGVYDVFVAKMPTNLATLTYASYLGGGGDDYGYAVSTDPAEAIYITGQTCPAFNAQTNSFPQSSALSQVQNAGTSCDAFVAKLGPAPIGLGYSTYLGGSGSDIGYGIAIDSLGSAYIAGRTQSSNLPLVIANQQNLAGTADAFVAKVSVPCTAGKGPLAYTGDGSIIDTENDCLLSSKIPGGMAPDNSLVGDSSQGAVSVSPDGTTVYGLKSADFNNQIPPQALFYDVVSKQVTPHAVGLLGGEGAKSTAVSPDGTRLFVTVHEDKDADGFTNHSKFYVLDTSSGQVLTSLPNGSGYNFDNVVSYPDGTKAYVAAYEKAEVLVFNTQTAKFDTSFAAVVAGDKPKQMTLTPDGKLLYVGLNGVGKVSVFDVTNNNQKVTDVSVGSGPLGLSVTPDGKSVYMGGDAVSVIDTATQTSSVISGVAGTDTAVMPDGKKVYVSNTSWITVIDTATNKPTKIILGAGGAAVAIAPPDKDGDGIMDDIDASQNVSSNDFNGAKYNDSGSGTIVDRGNLKVTVWRAFPKGFYARAIGATGNATINACGSDVQLPASAEVKMVCGSLSLDAIRGTATIKLSPTRSVSVPAGGSVKVTTSTNGQVQVDNLGKITLNIVDAQGQAQGTVASGQTFTTSSSGTSAPQVSCTPLVPLTYDAQAHGATCTAKGANNASVAGTWSYTYTPGGTQAPVNAGSYTVAANFVSSDANYTNTSTTLTITINKAALTITASSASKVQGTANPAFAATYSGFVGGETSQVLTGTLTFTTSATTSSPAGTYPITPVGLSSTNYSITFVDGTLTVTIPGTAFTIANRGGTSLTSSGTSASVGVGYGQIQPGAGSTTPSGVAIFGLRTNKVLVSETGVPASVPLTSGRIYAEIAGAVDTGLAIANPNGSPATINFYFTDSTGADLGPGSTTIAAGSQVAAFLDQPPFNRPGPFQGSFTFISNVPVAVVALRGLNNERGDFLMSTLPVIDTSATPATGSVTVPHFADGGGWTTQILLVNPGETTLTGTVQLTDANGAPVNVNIGGASNSSFAYTVSRHSSQKLVTGGAGTTTSSGAVRIVASGGGAVPVPLVVFSYKPSSITVSEAGVPVTAGTAFRMYVEASAPQSGNIQSGIAIANNSASAATVTFDLTTLSGASSGIPAVSLNLPGNGQTAKFLSDIFPSLGSSFQGVLRITTTSTGISVVGLRTRVNERSDFLITTTPPTVETAAAPTRDFFFPHLADGGGYTTQFILFSGAAGQTSTGTLGFFGQAGQTLNLTLH